MDPGPVIIYRGRSIQLNGQQFTVGRHPHNDLFLEEASVSRQHAVIVFQNGRWLLYDQGSSYGTFVNGQRISSYALQPGDQIRVGSVELLFEVPRPAAIHPWEQQTRYAAISVPVYGKKGFNLQEFWPSLTQGRKFSVSGALGGLILFFLPWLRLSCAGQVQNFSGYELATGTGQLNGITYLWLVPIAAVTIIALIYLRYSGQRQGVQASSRWELVASGLGLFSLLWLIFTPPDDYRQARQMGVEVKLLFGYWGTLAGFLLALWGSFKDYREGK